MATTADFRNGLCIEYNNDLYTIVQFQHVKPGKGPAFVRTKLKSLTNGRVIENTFNAGVKISVARVERRPYQFLYSDDIGYHFMHLETYEQISLETSTTAAKSPPSSDSTIHKSPIIRSSFPLLTRKILPDDSESTHIISVSYTHLTLPTTPYV